MGLKIKLAGGFNLGYKTLQGLYITKSLENKLFYLKYIQPPSTIGECFDMGDVCNCYYTNICIDYDDTNDHIFYINNKGVIHRIYTCGDIQLILNITNKCKTCCGCSNYIQPFCVERGSELCNNNNNFLSSGLYKCTSKTSDIITFQEIKYSNGDSIVLDGEGCVCVQNPCKGELVINSCGALWL